LREEKIDERVPSSLLNDATYISHIATNLLLSADMLWGVGQVTSDGEPDDIDLQLSPHTPLIQ